MAAEAIPDDVVRRAADGDDVGRAVAVEVAAPQVLRGDVAVEDGPRPGLLGRSKSYIETRWSLPRWPAKISSSPSPSTSATQRAWPSARVSSITVRGPNGTPCSDRSAFGHRRRSRRRPRCRARARSWRGTGGHPSAGRDGPRSTRVSGALPGRAGRQRQRAARLAAERGRTPSLDGRQDVGDDRRRRRRSPRSRGSRGGSADDGARPLLVLGVIPGREDLEPGRDWRSPAAWPRGRRSARRPGRAACRRRRRPSAGGECCRRRRSASSVQGSSEPLPWHGQQELALRRLVHRELVGDGDLGLAVAVEVGRRARDDAGRLLAGAHDPLLPRRVLVPGAGASAHGDDVGLLVAVDVGHLDLIGAREVVVDDDALDLGSRQQAAGSRQSRTRTPSETRTGP